MSRPREIWWGYVKSVIRSYPDLKGRYEMLKDPSLSAPLTGLPGSHRISSPTEQAALRQLNPTAQRELDAVEKAIRETKALNDGEERLRLIYLTYWKRGRLQFEEAARRIYVSKRTALYWHGDFVRAVADGMGLHSRWD